MVHYANLLTRLHASLSYPTPCDCYLNAEELDLIIKSDTDLYQLRHLHSSAFLEGESAR